MVEEDLTQSDITLHWEMAMPGGDETASIKKFQLQKNLSSGGPQAWVRPARGR